MRIIVTAGGSGGHIYPALAIIEKFKASEKNLEVLYIGTHNRMEKDIVPKHGIEYIGLEIYGLSKTRMLRNFKNIGLILKAKKKCEQIIKDFKPDIVLGIGGYVTYPVIAAAKKLGVKVFIHEQNALPGKTNKFMAKRADLIATSFPESAAYFKKGKKIVYTGHPSGETALKTPSIKRSELGFKDNKKLVTIVGGSLGSSSLNAIMKDFLLKGEDKNYNILYITGPSLYDEFIKDFKVPSNVKIIPYYDPLPSVLKITDILVSRAGAGIISEFLSLNIPTILIPSPNVANNHQYYNTIELKKKGAVLVIEEKHLNAQLLMTNIDGLLFNEDLYKEMKATQSKIKVNNSLDIIYKEIKGLLK